MEETLRSHLLALADSVTRSGGPSKPSIGKDALNDNTFFRRIERGDGFNIKTFDKVVRWFSDNWPPGADWPADVPRPTATSPEATPPAAPAEVAA